MKGKRISRTIYMAWFLLFMAGILHAQDHKVTGKVTDFQTGQAIPGVTVLVEGTATGTITDLDGFYTIELTDLNATLVFSYLGYLTENVNVEGKTTLDLVLTEDILSLDQVVVIGYGTVRKQDLTGAVTVVNTENMEKVQTSNIAKALQGQTSGVFVHGSGEPGAIPKINIRGAGSFGSSEPLYVIDGVALANQTASNGGTYVGNVPTGGISDFNMSDIESVQILKDASAAAIYGSRGANGVIIITTKRGSSGAMRLNYEGSYGVQNIVKRMDVTNREQFQEMNNMALSNDQASVNKILHPANDPTDPLFIDDVDTDWQKEVFQSGHITDHVLSLNGGTENNTYYASVNYFDQTGTMNGPSPSYTRYSVKLNADQKKGKLKFGESFTYTSSDQNRLSNSQWANSMQETVLGLPTVSVYDPNNIGGYGGGVDSVHGMIAGNQVGFNHLKTVNSKRNRFLGNIYGEYEIIKGLTYKLSLSYDRSDWFDHEFIPVFNIGSRHANPIAYLNEWRGENAYKTMENTITYNKTIDKNAFTLMVGNSIQSDYWQDMYGHAESYTEPYFPVLSAGTQNQSALGTKYEHTMLSYFGRLNYTYNDKYLLTVNVRRDGSSRFGPNSKWGNFPSYSGAWKISNESFFNVDFINLLKLRIGWGKIGNENIGDYGYQAFLNNATTYVFADSLQKPHLLPAASQTNVLDPSIHWEERITGNVGFEMAMLDNRIEFSAEYYKNNPRDMLLSLPIPWSVGSVNYPTTNAASMINKGFEFNLSYRKAEGDFHYDVSANLSTIKNEVTKLGIDNTPILTYMSKTEVGRSMGELYGWDFEGIFQTQEEIDNHAFQSSKTKPGDCMFKDVNGDEVINDEDRIYMGTAIPKLTGGLTVNMDYKGFDFSIFFQGVSGNTVWNGIYNILNVYKEGNYSLESYNNYWREDRPSDKYPRLTKTDANQNSRMSQRWLQNGSYLRVQNVQLGYDFKHKLLKGIPGVSSLRLYVSAQNLFTFTKYQGFDPDFNNDGTLYRGQDNGSYPSPRTLLFGIKLGL